MKVFSGSNSKKLAEEVSRLLNVSLAKSEVIFFDNSEIKVTIKEKVKDDEVFIIQSTNNPANNNLMELFFFADALKRQEAKKIIGIIPYFGYARQSAQYRSGEVVSANVIIRFLETVGFNKIYTFDLHSEITGGFFSIPFKNLTAFPLLAKKISEYFYQKKIKKEEVVLVSPDQGAIKKVRNFGYYFYESESFPEALVEKKRDLNSNNRVKVLGIYGNVKNKIALIVDDMVVSGNTLLPVIDLCLKKGAREVYAAAVHHDFTQKAPEKIQNSKLVKFFTTNTVELKEEQKFNKLIEFSIAPIIAQELKN